MEPGGVICEMAPFSTWPSAARWQIMIGKKTQPGFTIVELLIVIVVIAILAAISIVAYSGIQERAKRTQQITDIDKVGRAIQLWSAENGKSIGQSGHGYDGRGFGGFWSTGGSYPPPSLHDVLVQAGYLPGFTNSGVYSTYMLAPCTSTSDTRWVVLASLNPAPEKSAQEQIDESGCTDGHISLYMGLTNGNYNRNFMKVF